MRMLLLYIISGLFFSCDNAPSDKKIENQIGSSQNLPKYERIAQANNSERTYEKPNINIEVASLPDDKYYIVGYYGENYYRADSAVSRGGKLNFKNNTPYKSGLYHLIIPASRSTIQFLVDVDQTFSLSTQLTDIVGSMDVEGSLDNELFYQALKFEENQRPKMSEVSMKLRNTQKGTETFVNLINQQRAYANDRNTFLNNLFEKNPKTFFTSFKESGQNPKLDHLYLDDGTLDTLAYVVQNRKLFWDNVNFNDDRLLYTPVISNKVEKFFTELMPQNPDTIIHYASDLMHRVDGKNDYYKFFANWITLEFEPTKTKLMDAEAVFVHMIKNYFTYEKAFWSDSTQIYALQLRAYEMGNSLIGQQGPNITAKDPSGQMKTLMDLNADYIAVYLWNPDCEHCAEQTPKLVDYYNSKSRKEFDVYSIVVNSEDNKWRNAIQKYGISKWTNVSDPSNKAFYAKYYVDNTPELYILNPDRKIIGKNLKVFQIDTVVDRDKANR